MSLRSVRRRRQRLGLAHPERLEGRIALSTNSVAFSFTGASQAWTVPAGVQSVGFNATGGFGGGMGFATVVANQLSGVLTIPSGATALEVNVGGNGANQSTTGVGGWNGGGNGGWHENGGFQVGAGGGGASDIRLPGASAAQALVVAGGGGGFGGNGTNLGSNWFGGPGGAGGLVPQSGQVGSASGSGSDGGVGGAGGAISGPVGANGENTSNGDDGAGGGGGGGWNSGAGGGAGQADKISLQVAGGGGGGGGQSYASPTYVTGAVDTVNFGQFSPGVSVTYLTFDDSAPTKTIEAGQPTSWAYNAGASATYAVASGSLPPGMTLNGSTGVVAGTPLTTGVFTFAVSASLPLQQFGGTLVSTTSTTATVIPAGPTAPSSPTLTSAFAGPGTATVTWTAPSSSGSSPLVNYVIGVSPNGGQTWSIWASVPAGASQTNYTGFLPAGTYVFQVSAVNQTTVGPPSATSQPVTVTSVSNAPTNVSGVPGYESVALSWSAPTQTGGTPITGYGIRYSTDGGGFWAQLPNTGSAATSFTVTGLTSQAGYIFEVAAINAAGSSPWSQASPLLQPLLDPGAVTDVVAAPAYQAVALTWLPPANTAVPVTGYVVRRSDDSGNSWSTPLATGSTATQFTYPGLTQPVPLVFQVAAVNANGQGPWSTASAPVTPDTVPAAPSRLRALAGDRTVLLSWNPPADLAGGTLSGYRIEYQIGSGTDWIVHTASTGTTATQSAIVNLVNGTSYRFRVAAITQLGVGVPSQATPDVTPFTVPGAPLGLFAAAGNGRAVLAWQPPADDGGRRVVGYRIEASGQSGWYELVANTGTTATGYAATGLVNGMTYLFRVAAINAAGAGAPSVGSNPVVPAGPAAAPTQVMATTGSGWITLSWQPPVVTGGLPITSYVVRWSSDGGTTWTSADTGGPAASYIIGGLKRSLTYTVQIAAVTGAGQGAWSAGLSQPSAARSIGVQSLPGGRVRLTWAPPASTGGSPITGYRIWMSTNGGAWIAQQVNRTGLTKVMIGGLSRLSSYRFMVQPLSVAWPGRNSAPTRAVRPG